MPEPLFIEVYNRCDKPRTIYLRRPRPKRGKSKLPGKFVLGSGKKSHAVPSSWLIGAKDWEQLSAEACIQIVEVPFEPQFYAILNTSSTLLDLTVKVRTKSGRLAEKRLAIPSGKESRIVDIKAIVGRGKLNTLMKRKQLRLVPAFEIGPSRSQAASGSYFGENVYTCDDCGGPIVFRGSPPRPVHL